VDQLLNGFKEIPTTCISDALGGGRHMDPAIKPVKADQRVVGRAFTVQAAPADNLAVLEGIRRARTGDVLVVAAMGDLRYAMCGDFVAGMAQTLRIGGLVIDGVVRDIAGIQALDYPVFCRGTTVAASNKQKHSGINQAVSCGGIAVRPGDIIVGDVDGVVVVPQETAQSVLEKAKERMLKDEERAGRILGHPDAVKQYLDDILSAK
jgi:regulator of RNase E activity RraA